MAEISSLRQLELCKYDIVERFVRPEFHLVLVPVLGVCLRDLIRRLDAYIPGWRWVVDLLAGLCLLYGTFQRIGMLEGPCYVEVTSTDGIVYHFLVMSLLSWLAAVLLETEIIRLLWKVLLSCRDCQWQGLSFWKWFCLIGLALASTNACIVMINLSRNVYGSIINVTKDPNVLIYFVMAALVKNLRVFVQGIVFIIRIGASGFQWVEPRDQVNLSRMGHVALSNIIMIVQSGCLMYTFLNSKGSTSTWSVYQILLFLSLVLDTLFRVCMFLWCFTNSCCYRKIITACSRRNEYRSHPRFDQAVQESYTVFNPDIYLQSTVPHMKHLEVPDYPNCELVSSCYSGELCSIFSMAIPESKHSQFIEHEEYVCPECPVPEVLLKGKKTVIVVRAHS